MSRGKPAAHGIRRPLRARGRAAPEPARASAGRVARLVARIRGGDLGQLPVIVGLVVIWTRLPDPEPGLPLDPGTSSTSRCSAPRSARSPSASCWCCCSARSTSRSDRCRASPRRCSPSRSSQLQWNLVLALLAAIAVGCLVGMLYGFLYTRFGVPSFVITLAGLLGFLGLQLWVLGDTGSISLPVDSWIVQFAQQMFLPPWASYVGRRARGRRLRVDAHAARAPAHRREPRQPELPRDRAAQRRAPRRSCSRPRGTSTSGAASASCSCSSSRSSS